jgi:hypothetical protein
MSENPNWSANQLAFAEWLATPKNDRDPKTQNEVAEKLGLQPETLSRWKKIPGYTDLVYQNARNILDSRMPEILNVIAEKAEGGSLSFVKLALEVTGRLIDTVLIEESIRPFNADDYAKAAKELDEWRKAK